MEIAPLQVRLHHHLGKLPAGIPIQFTQDELALALIRDRQAVPVGDFNVLPALIVDEDDLEHVGCDLRSAGVAA